MESPQYLLNSNGSNGGSSDRNDLSADAFDIAVTWMKLPIAQRKALRKVIKELAAIK